MIDPQPMFFRPNQQLVIPGVRVYQPAAGAFCDTVTDVPAAECAALMAFYNATNGDGWTTSTGWGSDTTVGNWYGVTVAGGHVTELDLHDNGATLDGDGLGELAPLTSLTQLNLGRTDVDGDISGIDTLTSLEYLILNDTDVGGDISGIDTLTSLMYLYLQRTDVGGDISGIDTLTSLIHLYLDSTNVDGDISGIDTLTSLERLYLSYTDVDGDISGIDTLTSLERLYLSYTDVDGDISGIDTLTSLEYLILNGTGVDGDISGIDTLTSLIHLYLYNTGVDGDISGIDTLTSLMGLRLYNTGVGGDISGIDTLTSLIHLYLYNTGVSQGTIGTMTAMADCRLDDCGWDQAAVDALLADLYANWAGFTDATPELNIGGSNAAPSGTYQDGDPPSSGKEYIYEVCEDPETTGNETWEITYNNDGGGDITKP